MVSLQKCFSSTIGVGLALGTGFSLTIFSSSSKDVVAQSPTTSTTPETVNVVPVEQKIESIEVWINAFIPNNIPWLNTGMLTVGPYAGATALPGPLENFFLDDQRRWSDDRNEKRYRMTSHISIDVNSGKYTITSDTGRTIEVDPGTGVVECDSSALSPSKLTEEIESLQFKVMNNSLTSGENGDRGLDLTATVDGSAKNRCFTVSPHIDYQGTLHIVVANTSEGSTAGITFNGYIDEFPAFEMYASVNEEKPVALFQTFPAYGKSFNNLWGDASIPQSGVVAFQARVPN